MKKVLIVFLALMMAFTTAFAYVPEKLTTDAASVQKLEALNGSALLDEFRFIFTEDKEVVENERKMMYDFVAVEPNNPIEYFPEEVQNEIGVILLDETLNTNLALNMLDVFDFATVSVENYDEAYGVIDAYFAFETQYQVGQIVVVVFGVYDAEGIVSWLPAEAEVVSEGVIAVKVDAEDVSAIQNANAAALVVLADPAGMAGADDEGEVTPPQTGSKTAVDQTQIEKIESTDGELLMDDFRIFVVADKDPIVKEIEKLYAFVNTENKAPAEYFPEDTKAQVQTIMGDIALDDLFINEFVTVEAEGYNEEFGDVVVYIEFVTHFSVGQKVAVCLAVYTGETDENGEYAVEWVVLNAVSAENGSLAVFVPGEEVFRIQNEYAVGIVVLNAPQA